MTAARLVSILQPTQHWHLPEPTTYSSTTSTITDGGQSVSGKFLGSVVRKDIAQISMSWNYLSAEDWAEVNRLFRENHVNRVMYLDQALGHWDIREMYVSDRTAGLWRRNPAGDVLGWLGCGLQLTEV